jgi:NADPH2:quinone reductase
VRNADLMRTSRAVVGFWLVHLFRRPDELRAGIAELLGAVAAGELEVVIGGVYPLSQARSALEDIADRKTEGKLLLDPAA